MLIHTCLKCRADYSESTVLMKQHSGFGFFYQRNLLPRLFGASGAWHLLSPQECVEPDCNMLGIHMPRLTVRVNLLPCYDVQHSASRVCAGSRGNQRLFSFFLELKFFPSDKIWSAQKKFYFSTLCNMPVLQTQRDSALVSALHLWSQTHLVRWQKTCRLNLRLH